MNAIAERWVRSAKSECVDRLILFGTRHLEHALREFVAHYHHERPHQSLGNQLIVPADESRCGGRVVETQRLGGLLRSYRRDAA